MLEGSNWNESIWDWKRAILKFRKYVSKKDDDIFDANKANNDNELDTVKFMMEWLITNRLRYFYF